MKQRTIAIILFPILTTWFASCVDEIDVSVFNDSGTLVVDGMITDQPGPYTITLSRSDDFFASEVLNPRLINAVGMVQNAQVMVEDDKGNSEIFTETTPGVYQSNPSGMVGCVGAEYKLTIKLESGETYESSSEIISPNSGIKDYNKQQITKTILNENDFEKTIDGTELSIVPNGFESIDEFYRWRWVGTYQVEAFPELRVSAYEKPNPPWLDAPLPPFQFVPNPVPCSGYEAVGSGNMGGGDSLDLVLNVIGPCECCDCWVTESVNISVVSKTSVGATEVHFDFYEDINPRFGQKFYVRLQQLSLTKEAHEFWNIIEQQQDNNSLFASSGREIRSNIRSLDDENEKVLGYFMATSIDEIALFLNDENLFKPTLVLDSLKDDCRKLKNSTSEIPLFW